MSSKRKEYNFDRRAAKATKFFLLREGHIDPDMRVKNPAVMMAKGYSGKESKNRMLQMQVHQEAKKIRRLDPPHPPKAMAMAATTLLTCLAHPNATRATVAMITPNAPLAAVENDDSLARILSPSLMKKTQKTSYLSRGKDDLTIAREDQGDLSSPFRGQG
jgi:hypothetical protein